MSQAGKSSPRRMVLFALLGTAACSGAGGIAVETGPGGPDDTSATTVGTASLESELYRLMVSQAAHFEETGYYAKSLPSLDFVPGSGVRIDLIRADGDGFSAIATSGEAECAVYSGEVRSPRGYVSLPERPACRR
jgi:hypothetical protein